LRWSPDLAFRCSILEHGVFRFLALLHTPLLEKKDMDFAVGLICGRHVVRCPPAGARPFGVQVPALIKKDYIFPAFLR
jgi:hypothetical protein